MTSTISSAKPPMKSRRRAGRLILRMRSSSGLPSRLKLEAIKPPTAKSGNSVAADGHKNIFDGQASLIEGDDAIMHENDLFVKSCERGPVALKSAINHRCVNRDVAQIFSAS